MCWKAALVKVFFWCCFLAVFELYRHLGAWQWKILGTPFLCDTGPTLTNQNWSLQYHACYYVICFTQQHRGYNSSILRMPQRQPAGSDASMTQYRKLKPRPPVRPVHCPTNIASDHNTSKQNHLDKEPTPASTRLLLPYLTSFPIVRLLF